MKKFLKVFGIILILLCVIGSSVFAVWWFKFDGEGYYRYTWHKIHEPFTFSHKTNTDSIYSEDYFKETLEKLYPDLEEDDIEKMVNGSYIIPGLKSTRTITESTIQDVDICTSMTPQGVAITDKYVLISAYCQTKEHNSVLYVVDKESHDFIKEVVLPDKSHVGSVTYDDVNQIIWICCYEEDTKVAFVCSFTLEEMENYSFDDAYLPIKYSNQVPINTQKRASFMNYYDGSLYIGYFESNLKSESTIQEFKINEEGTLETYENEMAEIYDDEPEEYALPTSLFYINGNAQGMAIDDEMIFITYSSGSINNSKFKMFNYELDDDGNVDARDDSTLVEFDLPVMAEDISVASESEIYVCFESGAYAYRARLCDHIDRILYLPF